MMPIIPPVTQADEAAANADYRLMARAGTLTNRPIEEAKLRVLQLAAWFLLAAPALFLALLFGAFPEQGARAPGPALILLAALCTLICLRRGYATLAAPFLIYGSWAGIALAAATGGGVQAPQVTSLPLIVLLAGWLIGTRQAVLIAALSIALTLMLALAGQHGMLAQPAPLPPLLFWLPVAVVIALVCLLTRFIVGIYDSRFDETQRLNLELGRRVDELTKREAELRLLMESVPVMLFHGDSEKRCLSANRNYANFYRHEQADIIGRTVREIIGEAAYQTGVDELLDRVLAGERLAYRAVRRSAAGEDRVLDIEVVPDPDEAGRTRGFFAVFKDVTQQVATEEELRRTEERFALVFRSSPLAIAITRLDDGRYVDINEAFVRLFGWRREEVIGRTSLDIGVWSDPQERQEWATALRQAGRIDNRTVRFRAKDGSPRVVLLSAELIQLDNAECALVMAVDITERRLAEVKFAKVFHASPVAISISRLSDGFYLDINEAFIDLFGWSRDETIGRTAFEIGIWPSQAMRERWIAELRQAGRLKSYEALLNIKSGEQRTVLISSEPLSLDGVECVLNSVHDITDYRRVESALRESESRLREAQRIGHVGSWDLDLASLRLAWSDEIYKIYERGHDDFGGTFQDLLAMVHPDDLDRIRKIFRDSGKAAGGYEIDHRIITPDGRVKHLHVQWEVFLDGEGKPLRALGTAQDITAQVLAKEEIERLNAELESRVRERTAELQSANKELESFAYSISHDLRSPLRGIDGFSQLLREEYGERLDETGLDYLDRVRRAAQRMGTLIDDILELSRVTRRSMRRAHVDLSQFAREILEELAQSSPDRHAEVSIAEDCIAFGDPQLLRVLLQNLLENAWKYSGRQATTRIEFGRETASDEIIFFVRDNGVGFDMKYADRLFTPFQRLHKPEEFEGTGIGLATVARVVHRHGGRVWAEAQAGQGATLRFTIGHPPGHEQ